MIISRIYTKYQVIIPSTYHNEFPEDKKCVTSDLGGDSWAIAAVFLLEI